MAELNNYCLPPLPSSPLSLSILIDSPVRCNLPFVPVSALIFPLARANLYFAGLVIAALDVVMTFLFKRTSARPPSALQSVNPELYPVTLRLDQLTNLLQSAANGQIRISNPTGQGVGPVGTDEPLFPDNLSVSIVLTAAFSEIDGSPDSSFNVPLFEIPGAPGNLIIALGLLIAQFLVERAGVGTPGCGPGGNGLPDGKLVPAPSDIEGAGKPRDGFRDGGRF
ncbi:MAG: hypothetical protein M0T74_06245 [Desulfitobacterium hafniense]|nr:hypothetical protein [Desulfitobacterium hafniense]